MTIKAFFSPEGGCLKTVLDGINKSQKSIDVAMFYFTSKAIAQALVAAKGREVKIRIILDKNQEQETFSKSRYLIKKGIEVRYYQGEGLMHNKFAVIDGRLLITGSFNWTPTADWQNEENMIVIVNNEVVKKYQQRFAVLWKPAEA
ncbi:MAG: phospholipase D family protein [Candidatus Omnitrophica bacterium]|nr:phospholipase D family protein [Candidatus Omnitrophota bacterium]MDE2223525.1 phospholipase D family protein [Candidatus Omnitrophota bacterium]